MKRPSSFVLSIIDAWLEKLLKEVTPVRDSVPINHRDIYARYTEAVRSKVKAMEVKEFREVLYIKYGERCGNLNKAGSYQDHNQWFLQGFAFLANNLFPAHTA